MIKAEMRRQRRALRREARRAKRDWERERLSRPKPAWKSTRSDDYPVDRDA